MTETDIPALVESMKEAAAKVVNAPPEWTGTAFYNAVAEFRALSPPASVLSLIAAYEAEKERADCAEQSEAELEQGAKDSDAQIVALSARVAELEGALKPFSDVERVMMTGLPWSDYDRARDVLSQKEG